ncbi:MAG: hypothetical protein KDJ77_15500 [Rhodobiaceae bacterium]|nr:hypothetical protein [Rhodobiaceae bacterium]
MTTFSSRSRFDGDLRPLWMAIGLNLLWINLSEVFRYFAFVMPMMREALPMVPDVAPMNAPVFLVWGVWDTILVIVASGLSWLVFERFGPTVRVALAAGTLVWVAIFVILWLGLFNMNLAPSAVLLVALPLAWVEMVVAALIVRWVVVTRA